MLINHFARRSLVTAAAFAALAIAPLASAISFTNIYAFGDSLSDTGNIAGTTGFPLAPYTPGRFTGNFSDGTAGLVWVEYVAAGLGLSISHSVAGGNNYAWGGSRTGPINAGFPPSLLDQASFYLNDSAGVADPNALYSVFGGGNDVRDNVSGDSVANISSIITSLAGAGAMNFFVPNLPDIGMTPESLTDSAPGGPGTLMSQLTDTFNADLETELTNLEAALGVNIIRFDLFSVFNDIIADPAAFGLANVTEACYDGGLGGGGNVCADPDSHLFWDGIHPTAMGHVLAGNAALDAIIASQIPLPAALPLLLTAIGFLGLARRKAA